MPRSRGRCDGSDRGRAAVGDPPTRGRRRGALHLVGDADASTSRSPRSSLRPSRSATTSRPGRSSARARSSAALGSAVAAVATRGEHQLGVREGFLVVALTWLVAAALGALPYLLSGDPQLDRPVDAYFEAMSGFTTTGASGRSRTSRRSHSLLMWRQFTQWLGGMGIIVLALAVLPRLRVGGRQLLETEMPGPEIEPLSTRIRDTARRVWILYIALTGAADRDPAVARLGGRRRADDALQRGRARVRDHADRRLLAPSRARSRRSRPRPSG